MTPPVDDQAQTILIQEAMWLKYSVWARFLEFVSFKRLPKKDGILAQVQRRQTLVQMHL
jgi:hypothetical protein